MTKGSTYYQQRYRDRLKDMGFVKKEVWIPPQHSGALKAIEEDLREGVLPVTKSQTKLGDASTQTYWTINTLMDALVNTEPHQSGVFVAQIIEGMDPSIHLQMAEYGDLPVYISVCGSQIIVETLLWPVETVKDPATFNALVLKTHKLFPLSTCGIITGPDGQEYYEMFGALSAGSILPSILFEIEAVADNAIQAVEAYQTELKDGSTSAESKC